MLGDAEPVLDRESLWDVKLDKEPGLRIPNMLDATVEGSFWASTSCSPIPTPTTSPPASRHARRDRRRR